MHKKYGMLYLFYGNAAMPPFCRNRAASFGARYSGVCDLWEQAVGERERIERARGVALQRDELHIATHRNAGLRQPRGDGVVCPLGTVVFAAEVAQKNIFQTGRVMGGKELRRVGIAQVSRRRGDTPFEVGRIRARLQQVGIVIRFDNQAVRPLQVGSRTVGHLSEVGGEDETAVAALHHVAHVVAPVVRHLEGGEAEVANGERRLFAYGVSRRINPFRNAAAAVGAVENLARGIHGNAEPLAYVARAFHMVGMVVGEAQSHDRIERQPRCRQPLFDAAGRYAGVYQYAVTLGAYIVTVAVASARQTEKMQIHRYLISFAAPANAPALIATQR